MGIGPIWGITSLTFILSCIYQLCFPGVNIKRLIFYSVNIFSSGDVQVSEIFIGSFYYFFLLRDQFYFTEGPQCIVIRLCKMKRYLIPYFVKFIF